MHVLWVVAHPEKYSLNASLRDHSVEALREQGHELVVSARSSARRDRSAIAAWILVAVASGALPLLAAVAAWVQKS